MTRAAKRKQMNRKMEHRKQIETTERRYIHDSEVRAVGDSGRTIRGYAARFGSVYDMGWYTEELHRDALKNADMSDVRGLFNHDSNLILGRTKAGTVRVGVDSIGIWYEIDLPGTTAGNDILENIRVGNIDQSSWGFMLRRTKDSNGDQWERRNGRDHRILMDVETLFDVSPVTFPANPDTTVAKRSRDYFATEQPDELSYLLASRAAHCRALLALHQ